MRPGQHIVVLNWKDTAHPEAGGAEVYCSNVARELVASGCRVTYVTSRPKGQSAGAVVDGYAVRRMGGTLTVYPLVLLWLLLHRRRIDGVIDSQNGIPFFAPLAVRRTTPVALLIHHVHQDQFGMYFPGPMARVGRWLEGPMSRRVYGRRAICAVSPSTRTEVRRRLKLRGPIYVAPNGYRAAPVAAGDHRSVTPVITCVGRLVPHKRWNLLIDAVGELVRRGCPVQLHILGSGPEQDSLSAQVADLGLAGHVTLHGYVTNARRDELLSRAWLTACTSVGEGWGLSIIEAAALGVPAVALDVAGLRDSVRHASTGWLTTRDGLTDALETAFGRLSDDSVARQFADECRAWADSLRWSSTADRFRAVLESETIRAQRRDERRSSPSDSAVLIELDREAAELVDTRMLSATDQLNFCSVCLGDAEAPFRVLLNGADERDAATLLTALGLDPHGDGVMVRLCRSREQVQWHAGTVPHNAPSLLTTVTCPAVPPVLDSSPASASAAQRVA